MKRALLPLFFLFSSASLIAQSLDLRAPNPNFDFVNQKNGVGNSCGPACLLNSFGAGSEPWQACFQKLPGSSDRARIASVIKSWGQKPSQTFPNRKRWELRGGVNVEDLAIMAGEMSDLNWSTRKPRTEFFFAEPGRAAEKALILSHKRLAKSLKRGFPPILSVRRFVVRDGQWQSVHGHFVVLTAMPARLAKGASSFPVLFRDPSGAAEYQGEIALASGSSQGLPCLTLKSPNSSIGVSLVKGKEANALGLAGAIGAW